MHFRLGAVVHTKCSSYAWSQFIYLLDIASSPVLIYIIFSFSIASLLYESLAGDKTSLVWEGFHCIFFYRELLSGAVNRLGEDVLELCPTMKDREDEDEIQQNFCFVLANELERDGIIRYHAKRLLHLNEYVLPLFSAPDSTACLMLHVVGQEHGVMEESDTETTVDKVEDNKAVSGEFREVEREEGGTELLTPAAAAEGQVIWRQQDTLIIYDRDSYAEEADFEEDEEMAAMKTEYPSPDVPSKLTVTLIMWSQL